jgi:hypothetical protein
VLRLPQLAGVVRARAGWPGSNGSTMGWNATAGAVLVAEVVGVLLTLPAAEALWVAPPLAELLELLQPASTPTAMADMVSTASLVPCIRIPRPCDVAGASVARPKPSALRA